MKSITIGSQIVFPNKLEIDILSLKKDIKIIDAAIKLKVASSFASTFAITYCDDMGGESEDWGIVDLILTKQEKEVVTLDISDEIRNALEKHASKATFTFTSVDEAELSLEKESELKIDYISLSQFRENATCHKVTLGKTGEAAIDLSTGQLFIYSPLINSDDNPLPFSISANYCINQSKLMPNNTFMPKNWSLNIHQYLIKNEDKDKLSFTYIDSNGLEQTIEENYYYLDDAKNKCYIKPSDLTVDLDGNKKYGDHDILTELIAPSGLNLVSSIKDIKGCELVDYEPEELIQIREQIKQLENNKLAYENNQELLKKQLFMNCLSKYSSAHTILSKHLKEPASGTTQSDKFNDATQTSFYKNQIDENSYIFNSHFGDDKLFSKEDLRQLINNLESVGHYKYDVSSNYKNIEVAENKKIDFEDKIKVRIIGDNELLNTQTSIENIEYQYNESVKKLEEINKSLDKLTHKKLQLEMQVPVHYLYNEENIIYGFGKTNEENTFRLILITDSYENTIYLQYEALDSNKIESVQNSAGNVTLFEYQTNKLSITDSRDRKVELYYDDKLTKITHIDKTSSYFYYDGTLIQAILNETGIGVKFNYENQKVCQINLLSTIDKIEADKVYYKNQADSFDYQAFNPNTCQAFYVDDGTTSISYDNISSTTLILPKTESKTKYQTYIFDKSGNVNTITSLLKSFDSQEEKNYASVDEFSYQNNKISKKIKALPYSKDYLEDSCFDENAKIVKHAQYLGYSCCSHDCIPYQYEVCESYHTMPNNKAYCSVEMNSKALSLLNDEPSSCSHRTFVVSGWAKADSAFVMPDQLSQEEIQSYPNYIQNRKFEIRVEVSYQNRSTPTIFKKSFDWRNQGWQYAAVAVQLEAELPLEKIECFVDYSENTGPIMFSDLEFKEGDWECVTYNADSKPYRKESAHSEYATEYSYNEAGNLIKETIFLKNSDGQSQTEAKAQGFVTTYEYTKQGKLLRSTDYNGIVKENTYDENGQIKESITYHKDEPANKFYQTKKLDEKGKTISQSNELGEEVTYFQYLDDTGIVQTTTDENGVKTSHGYSPDDTLLQTSITVGGIENYNSYGYTLDRLTKLSHNDFDISYDYDKNGKLSKIKIADNVYLSNEYQNNQQLTKLASGEIYRQTLDENGNVLDIYYQASETELPQRIAQNIYDFYGNVVFVKEFENPNENLRKFTFNKFGKLTQESALQHDKTMTINNEYDDSHQNVESTFIKLGDKELEYYYKYSLSPSPKLEFISLPDGSEQFMHLDKLGRLDKIELENIAKQFSYLKCGDHASNLISKLQFAVNGLNEDNLTYKYDKKGNITEIRQNNNLIARYRYDALSRIVREDNKRFNKTTTLTYDAGGNITMKTIYSFTLLENLDALTPSSSIPYIYPLNGWRDQLKSFNGKACKYDALGNPTLYKDIPLTWSHGRRLDRFGDIANFTYDIYGHRTSKFANGYTTKFYLNGNKIIAQEDAVNKMYFFYGVDGVCGFELNGLNYYYKKNAQNDIIGIYNSNGILIARYDYDAYGDFLCQYLSNDGKYIDIEKNIDYTDASNINKFVTLKNPFRYRSYYYDYETNLYYLNSRYYDPETGRFINADDVSTLDITKIAINGLNLYAYCLNNPVNEVDENGYIPNWLKWLIGGLLVIAAIVTIVATGGAATGLVSAIAIGAAKGILVGASMGLVSGIASGVITNNWNGLADSFMWGAISGMVSGGISGGFGYTAKTGITLLGDIVKNNMIIGNKINIALQVLTGVSSYIGQAFTSGEKLSVAGFAFSIIGGVAGGTYFKDALSPFIINVGNGLQEVLRNIRKTYLTNKFFDFLM